MKKITSILIAASCFSFAIPLAASAVDHQEAYSCMVEARKCQVDISSIQAKLKKMNEAINQGAMYSKEDMMKLQQSISELQLAIDRMKPMEK